MFICTAEAGLHAHKAHLLSFSIDAGDLFCFAVNVVCANGPVYVERLQGSWKARCIVPLNSFKVL